MCIQCLFYFVNEWFINCEAISHVMLMNYCSFCKTRYGYKLSAVPKKQFSEEGGDEEEDVEDEEVEEVEEDEGVYSPHAHPWKS